MAWTPRVGLRVNTTHFGPGAVTRVTKGGALVRLEGLGGFEIEVAAAELAPLDGNGAGPGAAVETAPLPAAPVARGAGASGAVMAGDFGARRAVEALRFGLVPHQHIEDLTLGYDELRAWARGNFPHACGDRPRAAAVAGPFGTGKSHTMAVIRHLAREEDYVTARVEVDGQTISLAKPETFLRQLWTTTEARDFRSSTPVLDLYQRAIEGGHPPPEIAPDGDDRVRHNYTVIQHAGRRGTLEVAGPALDAILSSSAEFTAADATRLIGGRLSAAEGRLRVKRMLGNGVQERPAGLVATLAGHAAVAKLAGHRGLIVTIDEFEVEQVPSPANYERVRGVLALLTDYLRGRTAFNPAPLGLFFAMVGEDAHGGDEAIRAMIEATDGATFPLEPWPREHRRDLAARLHRLYAAAYALDRPFDPDVVDQIEAHFAEAGLDDSRLIRAFIKRYIGTLDALHGPAAPAPRVSQEG